jgi:dihydrofolate synthase/folylpolyglutamate synthase
VSHGGTVSRLQHGLRYLNTLTPWNGRGGFALEAITKVLKRLDDPQDSYPTIHIAGTNGKGTVSSATAAVLAAAGNKVGLNTSPHLQDLNERIVINGLPIPMDAVGELAVDIRNAAAKDFLELSFHEAITAISFLAFRELGVDWAVIEVGLGGRLDASNVISRPAATAIVTIDFDHQHILGSTLGAIAAEKAGIIKPGVPHISGLLPFEAEQVVAQVARNVKHYRFGSEFGTYNVASDSGRTFGYWGKDFPGSDMVRMTVESSLEGKHQYHNLSVAATLGLVVGMPQSAVAQGLSSVYWPARMERSLVEGSDILMDCAHNPAGMRAFVSYLDTISAGGIDLTFGVLDTKNWQEMVRILSPYVSHWRLALPDSERALPLHQLEEEIRLSCAGVRITIYGSDYDRLVNDLTRDSDGSCKFITGSMYMIGKLRGLLGIPQKPLWPPVA